jgi:hypothetical protein
MAGIWKRGNYWRAYIRRQGRYPPSKIAVSTPGAEAEAWARRIESEMDPAPDRHGEPASCMGLSMGKPFVDASVRPLREEGDESVFLGTLFSTGETFEANDTYAMAKWLFSAGVRTG